MRPLLVIAILLSALPGWAADTAAPSAGKRFYVLGEVSKPGDFEFTTGLTVKAALATAGGLSLRADKHKGVVIKENREKVSFDPEKLLAGTIPDIPLDPGDTVIVLPGTVKVTGKVQNPGSFDFRAGMTIRDAISSAGDLMPDADNRAVRVEREGKTITVDLSKPADDPNGPGLKLQVGDVVNVPGHEPAPAPQPAATPPTPGKEEVTITGEVTKPGQYALVPGEKDHLRDLITMAGGLTSRANMKKIRVQSVQEGKRPVATYDLTKTDASQNPAMRAGDTVFVPTVGEKKKVSLGEVYQIVAIAYLLVQIFK